VTTATDARYRTTVGLEIHVELQTLSKMFCGCEVAFGGEPNSRTCPVCLGLPGSLPVVNHRALEHTISVALALNCKIAGRTLFARKNYFYPDMPKNYQISQYDLPIGYAGHLSISGDFAEPKRSRLGEAAETKSIGITRVHLEEDTGKSQHIGGSGRIADSTHSLEDFNRAGTPLVEIVTDPDLSSAEEARTFVHELRALLETLGVSDVRMEEGSLRVDANISVAPTSESGHGTKVEIKNMNSVRSVGRALAYEERRQREALERGELLVQETRHFDERTGTTSSLRSKEYAFDYRYFPEPDLVAFEPSKDLVERIRASRPELPGARRARFVDELGLAAQDAAALTTSRATAEWFESAATAYPGDARKVANWVLGDLFGLVNSAGIELSHVRFAPRELAALIELVDAGRISGKQAKRVLPEMFATGERPDAIAARLGLEQISDASALESVVDEVIAANREAADRVRAGQHNTVGWLVGQVMKKTRGQANPKLVSDLLNSKLVR
jgi:aspartyl-tRNA(Asn)/glutamyl-tRNA(Gln) amidotransferase subunit B